MKSLFEVITSLKPPIFNLIKMMPPHEKENERNRLEKWFPTWGTRTSAVSEKSKGVREIQVLCIFEQ